MMKQTYILSRLKKLVLSSLGLSLLIINSLLAQQVENDDISIRKVQSVQNYATRIDIDQNTNIMYYTTWIGSIYELKDWSGNSPIETQIAIGSDHGITTQLGGMTIHEGVMYIIGSTDQDDEVQGIVMKATLAKRPLVWKTVAKSDLYKKSNTAFDHRMNSIEVDPTGQYLFINSGSRTDHGEEHLGFREVPLTAKILRIPITSDNLVLKNDVTALAPYVFAEGTRNDFGMAWNHKGHLFSTENSGDRDHSEEMNWLREGHHYGFPWNLGGTDNPQQFEGYAPGTSNGEWWNNPSDDPFIQAKADDVAKSIGWVEGYFHDDPNFPQKPEELVLTMPIQNVGPFADQYRDADDLKIKDGSDAGVAVYTFSSHLSPVGLDIDRKLSLRKPYNGHAFAAIYNKSGMVDPFNNDGAAGSILDIELIYDSETDNYKVITKALATGFNVPIDVKLYKGKLFVIEINEEKKGSIWEISLQETVTATANKTSTDPTIDGVADAVVYDNAEWVDLKYLHVDNVSANKNTFPSQEDASGRYKAIWKGSKLFVLAEITDDNLDYDPYDVNGQPNQIFNGDVLEIFVDEDLSGGAHTKTHNAFAFHISPNGKVADQCGCGDAGDYAGNSGDWNGRLFNDIVTSAWTKNGNKYTWEASIEVHNDAYDENTSDHSATLTTLEIGQVLGFGVGYNDYDGADREHLITSFPAPGNNNGSYGEAGGRNVGWQDASSFGYLELLDECNTSLSIEANETEHLIAAGYGTYKIENWITATSTDEISFTGNLSDANNASLVVNSSTGDITLTETKTGLTEFQILVTISAGCAQKGVLIDINVTCEDMIAIRYDNQNLQENFEEVSTVTPIVTGDDGQISYSLLTTDNLVSATIDNQTGEVSLSAISGKFGTQTLTVNAAGTCNTVEASFDVVISPVTGIASTYHAFGLYPNPANEDITIQIKEWSSSTKIHVSIHAQDGRLIKQSSEFIQSDQGINISIADLKRGLYIISLQVNGQTYFNKFVKD